MHHSKLRYVLMESNEKVAKFTAGWLHFIIHNEFEAGLELRFRFTDGDRREKHVDVVQD